VLASRPITLLAALLVGVVFVVGLLVEGLVGGLIVLGVAALLTVLTAAAWGHLPERGRGFRIAVIAVVAVIGVIKIGQAV
jgi:hypothetical protein